MKVSAIVPAYNCEKYLGQAVRSLLATNYPDLEIMIVDDGSQDGTRMVAAELREEFPGRVRILRHSDGGNHGVSATRNLGILASTGEALCFLDADDRVYPHRFDVSVPILRRDEGVDAVYELTGMRFEGEGVEEGFCTSEGLFGIHRPYRGGDLLQMLLSGTTWATSAILVRRTLLKRTGLFRENLRFAEDCNLWMRMAAAGRIEPGNMENAVSIYRRHGGNTFHLSPERKVDMLLAMLDAFRCAARQPAASSLRPLFRKRIRAYAVNALIVARESGRGDLVLPLVRAFLPGSVMFLCDRAILRQLAVFFRDRVTNHD